MSAITKIFGTHSERELKRIYPLVDKVESYREAMGALSDEELKNKTKEYKERLENGETLDDLLPEAYATVREAAKRVLGMEHYRVQIIGGIILHQGRIAEMKTGEGKTLVSTLPAYLNALEGKGVCIVTVNDYLAKRDSEWMGQVHEFLGLKVGVVLNEMTNDERRDAYNCDITYVTNNELGFDYLRDNMVIYKEQLVQRGLHFAIIDEVDSVLIDEARTPLIISGQSGKSTRLYEACDILACQMKRGEDMPEYSKMDAIMGVEQEETGDFIVNEKDKVVSLTQDGVKKVEQFFKIENLADPENLEIQHNIILELRAHNLMFRDQDYVVKDDQVMIVDVRALQERKVKPIGSNQEIAINVRLISATNENLRQAIEKGDFREDLYHRINEFTIRIPDLKERKEDLLLFANHFLDLANSELQKDIIGFDNDTMQLFQSYSWPGNLRQMKNVIKYATLLATGRYITRKELPEELTENLSSHTNIQLKNVEHERDLIRKALQECGNNKTRAAQLLGIDRKTLYNKLKIYQLD